MEAQPADSNQFHQHTSSALDRQPVHCYILADTQRVILLPAMRIIISILDGNQT